VSQKKLSLAPCWKCGSPGTLEENGGYQCVVCTNTRNCANSGNWGISVQDWNRGGLTEVQKLRQLLEQERSRTAQLERQVQRLTHYEETAARELLFWWAERLSNAPNEDLKEVVRQGYQRIINLANMVQKPEARNRK